MPGLSRTTAAGGSAGGAHRWEKYLPCDGADDSAGEGVLRRAETFADAGGDCGADSDRSEAAFGFLVAVGLEYLTLDRLASTLSGGEAQRIQLATSLGSRLVGALYVLDEPSIGLHTRDTARLIHILEELRDLGNTILVVEHDADILRAADLSTRPWTRRGRVRREIAGGRCASRDRSQSSVADGALFEREDFDSRTHA